MCVGVLCVCVCACPRARACVCVCVFMCVACVTCVAKKGKSVGTIGDTSPLTATMDASHSIEKGAFKVVTSMHVFTYVHMQV